MRSAFIIFPSSTAFVYPGFDLQLRRGSACSGPCEWPLGNLRCDPSFDFHRDPVEQFVDRDESQSAHIPVRLFHLGVQINRRRQVLVQKFDGLRPDVLGQCVVSRLHGEISTPWPGQTPTPKWRRGRRAGLRCARSGPRVDQKLANPDHSRREIADGRLGIYSDPPALRRAGGRLGGRQRLVNGACASLDFRGREYLPKNM
jgi:hypothetical protein